MLGDLIQQGDLGNERTNKGPFADLTEAKVTLDPLASIAQHLLLMLQTLEFKLEYPNGEFGGVRTREW